MRITPQSRQEIAASKPVRKGIYEFELFSASDEVSKAGRDMIVARLYIKNQGKVVATITDYLTDKTPAAKLRHLCDLAGCIQDYESGDLRAAAFVGKTGRCRVVVVRDRDGMYEDRNSIADYLTGPFSVAPSEDAA